MAKDLEELKAQAADKAKDGKKNGGIKKTIDTLKFKKGSGVEACVTALERAKTPIAENVVLERAAKVNKCADKQIKNAFKWLGREGIVLKGEKDLYTIQTRKPKAEEEDSTPEPEEIPVEAVGGENAAAEAAA